MYVLTPGTAISKQGGRLIVKRSGGMIDAVSIAHFDYLILGPGVRITLPAIRCLLQGKKSISLLNKQMKLVGRWIPPVSSKGVRFLHQYKTISHPDRRLALARQIVQDKIDAMIAIIQKYKKNYNDRSLKLAVRKLKESLATANHSISIDKLRGVEGSAASIYWQVLRGLNRSELTFSTRSTRPPKDPLNAMFSFGYALLVQDMIAALESVGLDPYLGFYHENQSQRPALALDLMEPLRHKMIDALVLREVNLGRYSESDFRAGPNGGTWLTTAAAQRFARRYLTMRQREVERDKPTMIQCVLQAYLPLLGEPKPLDSKTVSKEKEMSCPDAPPNT